MAEGALERVDVAGEGDGVVAGGGVADGGEEAGGLAGEGVADPGERFGIAAGHLQQGFARVGEQPEGGGDWAESTGLVSTLFIPATRQRSMLSREVCAVRAMIGVVPPLC